MKRVQGSAEVRPLECINPRRNKWRVRWDIHVHDDGTNADYMEAECIGKPSVEEVRKMITSWHNKHTQERILKGFSWKGMPIWLSQENQFNYKAYYDLAVQRKGLGLPLTFKFGTDEEPIYYTFEKLTDLADFYISALSHIQECLTNGWRMKEAVNFNLYCDETPTE